MNKEKYVNVTAGMRSSAVAVLSILAATYVMTLFMPDYSQAESYGIFSIIPAVFLVAYICITRRIMEALIIATIMGYMMVDTSTVLTRFSTNLLEVLMSEDIAWLTLVCGLMGSIICLMEMAGGAFAFGEWVAKRAKTKKAVLMWTWLLGIIIFLDDYLNALVVGSCMAPLCDKHKTPREFLAFIVDSTSAPMCVLIPISTWGVFVGRLLETNNWAPAGEGLKYFIKTIPYDVYAYVGVILVPLFILGAIPSFGPMKKAEQRVLGGGPAAPAGSEKIDIRGGVVSEITAKPKMVNFLVPIGSLIFFTIIFDVNMAMGVYCTMGVVFLFYMLTGVMTPGEFWDNTLRGIKNMINPIMLMVLAFLFARVNSEIGFTEYMIDSAAKVMSPQWMPAVIFIVLSLTEFITGSNWGMYIIALPIVIPLAMHLNVPVPLAVGTVISAGVFGSHICFYSDATIITSAATGCENFAHAKTQIPYGLVAFVISLLIYIAMGYMFC